MTSHLRHQTNVVFLTSEWRLFWRQNDVCFWRQTYFQNQPKSNVIMTSESDVYLTSNWRQMSAGKGHHFIKLWWAGVIDATYRFSWKSACRLWWRRFLSGFSHIWAWRPSLSCNPDFTSKLSFPLPIDAPHKISLWLAKRIFFIYIFSLTSLSRLISAHMKRANQ